MRRVRQVCTEYRGFFALLILLIPITSRAVELYESFPETIHANERYVIYSHGFIVEGDNPRPISPKYGQYDFPGIKRALFDGGGFNLIAYQRPKNSDFDAYVGTLESWVKRLRSAGVTPGFWVALLAPVRRRQRDARKSRRAVTTRASGLYLLIDDISDLGQRELRRCGMQFLPRVPMQLVLYGVCYLNDLLSTLGSGHGDSPASGLP